MNKLVIKDALELAEQNYKDYSLYVGKGRAYPCIYDGLKSSYKRAIYGMYKNNHHKIVKVAELAAHALPYHPHPTSISGVVVQLGDRGNKLKLMETQGNWGDSSRGIAPSADRYIGGYLSPLAESLLCDGVEYCKFIKGEIDKDEPEALPVLLPLCFINGLKGIPSGLPTLNIPTINIEDMIDYYLNILKHKDINFVPRNFPQPNYDCKIVSDDSAWDTIMKTGKGTIRLAPVITIKDKVITISQLPQGKTVEHVHKLLEKEFLADKIDIRDESTATTSIVIEKVPNKSCDMNELYDRLYTKLQSNEICNMAFFDSEKIYVPCGFDKVVKANLQYLIDTHSNKLSNELLNLKNKLKVLEIIEDLKKSTKLKSIMDLTFSEAVDWIVNKYKVEVDIASKVLYKPISYLTKEHSQEIVDLTEEIKLLEIDKKDIFEYLSKKYKQFKKDIKKVLNT